MPATFKHGHALIVGVGADLPETVADAQSVFDVLTNPNRAGFPPDQVACLANESATRAKSLTDLDDFVLKGNTDAEAKALIY